MALQYPACLSASTCVVEQLINRIHGQLIQHHSGKNTDMVSDLVVPGGMLTSVSYSFLRRSPTCRPTFMQWLVRTLRCGAHISSLSGSTISQKVRMKCAKS